MADVRRSASRPRSPSVRFVKPGKSQVEIGSEREKFVFPPGVDACFLDRACGREQHAHPQAIRHFAGAKRGENLIDLMQSRSPIAPTRPGKVIAGASEVLPRRQENSGQIATRIHVATIPRRASIPPP